MHVHGPGKRWEGEAYTCTACRAQMRMSEAAACFEASMAALGWAVGVAAERLVVLGQAMAAAFTRLRTDGQ